MKDKSTLLQSIINIQKERLEKSNIVAEEIKAYESEIIDAMLAANVETIAAKLECDEKCVEHVTLQLKQYARGTMMTTYYIDVYKTYTHESLKDHEKHRAFWHLTKDIYESDNYEKRNFKA